MVSDPRHAVYERSPDGVSIRKNREQRLTGAIVDRLRSILEDIYDVNGLEPVDADIMPVHVRLVIDSLPKTAPLLIVNWIKGSSARWANQRSDDRSTWTRSYYVGSAGSVSKDAVERYIQEQTEQQA